MNENKYYLNTIARDFLLLMLSGSVIQMFLAECGISEQRISFYVSLMQIVQVSVMTFFSPFIDKIKNIIKITAFVNVLELPMILFSLFVCLNPRLSEDTKYIAYLITGTLASVSVALYSVLCYKLPYHILNMERYGLVSGRAGMISGAFSVIMSLILAFTQGRFSYFSVMPAFFIVCIIITSMYTVSTLSYNENTEIFKKTARGSAKKISLLRYGHFVKLIIPNFTRGFCMGIVGLAVTIGYYFKILDVKTAGVLVVITYTVVILSATAFPFALKFLGVRKAILISSLCLVVTLPLMFVGGNAASFLIFYGVSYFFVNIIATSVPVAVAKLIDYEVAGRYNGLRMVLYTGGVALGGFVCMSLCDMVGGIVTMLIAASAQALTGVMYYTYLRKMKIR